MVAGCVYRLLHTGTRVHGPRDEIEGMDDVEIVHRRRCQEHPPVLLLVEVSAGGGQVYTAHACGGAGGAGYAVVHGVWGEGVQIGGVGLGRGYGRDVGERRAT